MTTKQTHKKHPEKDTTYFRINEALTIIQKREAISDN